MLQNLKLFELQHDATGGTSNTVTGCSQNSGTQHTAYLASPREKKTLPAQIPQASLPTEVP